MPRREKRRFARYVFITASAALFAAVVYGFFLAWRVTSEFSARSWDRPALVYAAPIELYGGRRLARGDLTIELVRLGYRETDGPPVSGQFLETRDGIELHTRSFDYAGTSTAGQAATIRFAGDAIAGITGPDGQPIPILQLDPLLIGSIYPVHGEDRIVVVPNEVPELLESALIAVEDRRYERHIGVDFRAIARAALVNVTAGEIQQGASTLTQQLVRSFFLSNDRTWRRKISEAFMAMSLELRYDKDELLQTYINEVYLGQDGTRAIHGFGLASRFYFGKPLGELDIHEIALLVAVVRGPSYYDPFRNGQRALERRDLVLDLMASQDVITREIEAAAKRRPLGIVDRRSRQAAYYAPFLDLVRRQLDRDYEESDLEASGLRVYTTLDPATQALAEWALSVEVERFEANRPPLEGAVIVTNPHNAEVRAIVGGRQTGFDGFNRALNANRPVGSLIKPAVYLAALESGRHSLASLVSDEPISVPVPGGTVWSPTNFDDESHGPVTAIRALAESFNQATVRLGLDIGLPEIIDLLRRLGLEELPAEYPSLLLGAFELTPLEVTQIYNTLANGGFRMPLRSVRSVVAADGATIRHYPIDIEQTVDPGDVYELNQALVEVMRLGTGRTAASRLPESLVTAGKTGTSDSFRDSWFAGFSNDHLVVAWIGNDDNAPTGLTGGTGASQVFAATMAGLQTRSYSVPVPSGYQASWVDFDTGLETDASCPRAVRLSLEGGDRPPKATDCGSDRARLGSRIRTWLRGAVQ
ncbi:MAG TPA: penicillin-binding protein 1B [Gammaproteobacteria bacterium]|nr:penicillin-binding protein 1B [Gammaproteobacteria bacterium]